MYSQQITSNYAITADITLLSYVVDSSMIKFLQLLHQVIPVFIVKHTIGM